MKINLRSGYLGHILTLLSGTALAQIVLLVALPFLTRLFSPVDFGLYGAFVAVTAILGMVANGRFDLAILIPKDDGEAKAVNRICFQINLFLLILMVVVILIMPGGLLGDYAPLVWWIPVSVFLQGLLQPASRILLRKRKFKVVTYSKIVGSVVTVAVSIVLALLEYGFEGLVIGKICGQLLETIISGGFKAFGMSPLLWDSEVFKKYTGFLKFSSFEAILNNFFKQLPVLALSGYFSEALAGFYTLAMNVTSRPSGMVSQSVSQVFFKEASEMESNLLATFFLKNAKGLLVLIISPALLVFFFGSEIFCFLFGAEWVRAGTYASWLMPFVVVTFIKAGVSPIIDLKNKMHLNLIFEFGFVLLSLLSFWVGWYFDDGDIGVKMFSWLNASLGLFQLFAFYQWSKSKSGFL